MVFERFNEHFFHFQFKTDDLLYCDSQYGKTFENKCTFATLSKTYKTHKEMKKRLIQTKRHPLRNVLNKRCSRTKVYGKLVKIHERCL